jgi:ribosome-binding protein aMBF1 (putative translation factor)
MDCQDWTTVTVKRHTKAKTPVVSGEAARMRKLENDDIPKPKTIHGCRQTMIQARVAKGWNQTQLNLACGFPVHTIRDIESGKAQPSPQQLTILSRVLSIVMKYD